MPPARARARLLPALLQVKAHLNGAFKRCRSGTRGEHARARPVERLAWLLMLLTSILQAICTGADVATSTGMGGSPTSQAGHLPPQEAGDRLLVEPAAACPTAAELQRAAEAVLMGQTLPGAAVVKGPVTVRLLTAVTAAVETAMEAPQVVAAGMMCNYRALNAKLGLVAAALLGSEHGQPELAAAVTFGKWVSKTTGDSLNKIEKVKRSIPKDLRNTRHRHKGSAAELAEKEGAISAAAAAAIQALEGKVVTLPPSFRPQQAAVAAPVAARALPEPRDALCRLQIAAASLAEMASPPPAERPPSCVWSCRRCGEFLAEAAQARQAAERAEQARFLAEHLRTAAYADVQVLRQATRESAAALEAAHKLELEQRAAAHAEVLREHSEALLGAREEAAAALALAEERRKEVVLTKQHHATLSINTFKQTEELRKAKAALARAKSALERRDCSGNEEQQRAASELRATEEHAQERVAALEAMLQMERGAALMQHEELVALQKQLLSEKIRRGMAAAVAEPRAAADMPHREAHSSSGGQYGRSKVSTLLQQLRTKYEHIESRDSKLEEMRAELEQARLGHHVLS